MAIHIAHLGELVELDEDAECRLQKVGVLGVRHVGHTTRQVQAHSAHYVSQHRNTVTYRQYKKIICTLRSESENSLLQTENYVSFKALKT
jgi:hypothetical protein